MDHNQIMQMNGTHPDESEWQYNIKENISLKIDIISFYGPHRISKWIFWTPLNKRKSQQSAFANSMLYSAYVYNHFEHVWRFQVIWKKNVYRVLNNISRTSKQIVNLEGKEQSNWALNWNEHLSKIIWEPCTESLHLV